MKIARKVPGVDVIVGADHHHFLYKGVPPTDQSDVTRMYPLVIKHDEDSNVLIVQTTNFGKYLGHLQMTFDEEGKITHFSGNPILLNSSITQDPDTLAEVEAWAIPIRALEGEVVGRSYSFLDGRNPSCRARECNLGNLLTDAFLWEHVQFQGDNGWSNVSIAMMCSGGIGKSISAGDIKATDVTDVLPFGNTIDVVEIKGRIIVEILERSMQEYDLVILPGFFLQYSGLIVVYDVTQPPGSRVVSVLVRCTFCAIPNYEVLEKRKTYKVVMPSYLADGGDGYSVIPEQTLRRLSGRQDAEVVIDYLRQHSPIAPGPEKRIRILGDTSPLANFCR
ncbi:5'-nucleotidase [Holothuria leucospilota]|uniref:5'-nucleotidase n=1 Tax=Holothuria leucospilota TaxID=206669 RepID=A0A9Q0YK55_HOLLE|nr:5'-nucleotidase [Holothuria leucospilota]